MRKKDSQSRKKPAQKIFWSRAGLEPTSFCLADLKKAVTSMPSASRSSVAQLSVSASQLIKLIIKSVSSLVLKKEKKVTAIVCVFLRKAPTKKSHCYILRFLRKTPTQKVISGIAGEYQKRRLGQIMPFSLFKAGDILVELQCIRPSRVCVMLRFHSEYLYMCCFIHKVNNAFFHSDSYLTNCVISYSLQFVLQRSAGKLYL